MEGERDALLSGNAGDPDLISINSSAVGNNRRLWKAVLIVLIAPFCMGMVLGYSSPAIPNLKQAGLLTREQATWFGSLITIGAIAGGVFAGLCVEKLGRKTTIMLSNAPYVIGWFLIIYAKGPVMLYVGRLFTGLAVGMTSLSAPLFIGEVSTKELRGMFGSGFQLSITIGNLTVYSLGLKLRYQWLALAALCFPVIITFLALFLPETPRWLISKGERMPALDALKWYRGANADVEGEYQEIESNLMSQSNERLSCADLRRPGIYKPLLVSIGLMFFQQASGINIVIFYSETIFDEAGFKYSSLGAIIVGAVQVVATFVACILMDRAGRRVLLFISGVFLTVGSATLGAYYYLHNASLSWLALLSVVVFIIAFSLGWGPIPWLSMGEMFPAKSRELSSSIATAFNWTVAFIVTKEFDALEAGLNKFGTFWLFAGISLLGAIFVIFVPETKGKTLEEIEKQFEGRRT